MFKGNPSFHHIRSSFEARSKSTSSTPCTAPSRPQSPLQQRQQARQSTIANTSMTEQLLSIPASLHRPTVGTSRPPSWIGPPTIRRPSTDTMKQKVRITYASADLQPPVFVTTSLSEPQWEPLEMELGGNENGVSEFFKDFEASEGEYQYKFRLGPGDWWVFDGEKPSVDDGFGNKNNLLVVEKPKGEEPVTEERDTLSTNAPTQAFQEDKETASVGSSEDVVEPEDPPLLRHESLAPESAEQTQAPLFRHESIAIDDKKEDSDSSFLEMPHPDHHTTDSFAKDAAAPEPDHMDLAVLEKFPEDRAGIMESIRRTSTHMPVDETSDGPQEDSPRSRAFSETSFHSTPSLPSVKEDLAETAEVEGEEAEAEQADGSHDSSSSPTQQQQDRPSAPMTPPLTPTKEDKPSSPETVGKDAQQGEAGPSTGSRSTLSSQGSASQQTKKQGFLTAFLSVLMGFGDWFTRLCGGRTSATAIVVGLTASVAAGIWKVQNV